jgi:hypothetical protein
MKIEDFIAKLEEEYEDLAPGSLKPDSVFREVFEWNSINALILIDIAASKTVEDLFGIIKSRVQ